MPELCLYCICVSDFDVNNRTDLFFLYFRGYYIGLSYRLLAFSAALTVDDLKV